MFSAISISFGLVSGGEDIHNPRTELLNCAWNIHSGIKAHSKKKKKSTESLHIQLITATLASSAFSVFYDKIYGDAGHPGRSNPVQLISFVLTILTPLFVVSVKQESDGNISALRWAAFNLAWTQIESEIYLFRTQAGPYHTELKGDRAIRATLTHFAMKIREIMLSVEQYLSDDGMDIPENMWETGGTSESRADGNAAQLEGALKRVSRELNQSDNMNIFNNLKEKGKSPGRWVLPGRGAQNSRDDLNGSLNVLSPDERTPILSHSDGISMGTGISVGPFDSDCDEEDPLTTETLTDNGYSPMTAEEYVDLRMRVQMQKKSERLPLMSRRNEQFKHLIQIITIVSGGAAALSLQWIVPVVMGVIAALGSGQDFRKYSKRIESGNAMILRLNALKIWWMGLSVYQKRLPTIKDRLVLGAEKIIISETKSSFGATESTDGGDH